MKAGIIHNDHAFGFKAWNKSELAPVIKYMAFDILFKVIQGKQHFFIESTDDIGTLFCLPVVAVDSLLNKSSSISLNMIVNSIVLLYRFYLDIDYI